MKLLQRGNTMVSLLVTIAIIAILAVIFFKGGGSVFGGENKSPRADGKGKTTLGLAIANTKDDVCRSNLGQVRAALQIATQTGGDEAHPQDIHEARLSNDFYKCPLGGEPYKYDPATGTVQCVHPGHEKF